MSKIEKIKKLPPILLKKSFYSYQKNRKASINLQLIQKSFRICLHKLILIGLFCLTQKSFIRVYLWRGNKSEVTKPKLEVKNLTKSYQFIVRS